MKTPRGLHTIPRSFHMMFAHVVWKNSWNISHGIACSPQGKFHVYFPMEIPSETGVGHFECKFQGNVSIRKLESLAILWCLRDPTLSRVDTIPACVRHTDRPRWRPIPALASVVRVKVKLRNHITRLAWKVKRCLPLSTLDFFSSGASVPCARAANISVFTTALLTSTKLIAFSQFLTPQQWYNEPSVPTMKNYSTLDRQLSLNP